MGDLLGKYADLMEGFNDFLAQCEKNGNIQTIFSLSIKSFCSLFFFFFKKNFLIKCCRAEGFLAGVMNKST